MLGVTTSYNTAVDISKQEPHPFKGGFYLLSEAEDQNFVSPQLPCMDLMSSANHFAKQLVLSGEQENEVPARRTSKFFSQTPEEPPTLEEEKKLRRRDNGSRRRRRHHTTHEAPDKDSQIKHLSESLIRAKEEQSEFDFKL